jgi:hypothetical protein
MCNEPCLGAYNATACAAFDASQKLDPTLELLLNQVSCREENGQLAAENRVGGLGVAGIVCTGVAVWLLRGDEPEAISTTRRASRWLIEPIAGGDQAGLVSEERYRGMVTSVRTAIPDN